MKVGDEILLKAKIIDTDSNPHGPAIKVEVHGMRPKELDYGYRGGVRKISVAFWIHRLDQPEVVVIPNDK